jgi:indoleacetamide hydrolase
MIRHGFRAAAAAAQRLRWRRGWLHWGWRKIPKVRFAFRRLCGIDGFRPTTFRYPSAGVAPISGIFDQVGPHARTVTDLALFDAVVTGDFSAIRPMPLKGLKLGVGREYWFANLDDEVKPITNGALRKLQDAGVERVEAEVDDLANLIDQTTLPILFYDILRTFPKYLEHSGASEVSWS